MKRMIFVLPIILLLGCAPTETVDFPKTTEINNEEIKEQLKILEINAYIYQYDYSNESKKAIQDKIDALQKENDA